MKPVGHAGQFGGQKGKAWAVDSQEDLKKLPSFKGERRWREGAGGTRNFVRNFFVRITYWPE